MRSLPPLVLLLLSCSASPGNVTPRQGEQPRTLTGHGQQNSDAFPLAGGAYRVSWQATPQPDGTCMHAAFLKPASNEGGQMLWHVTDYRQIPGGETMLHGVAAGDYYLQVVSSCPSWNVTISPA